MNLYKSFSTVGGFTLLSRVMGFLRDIMLAAVLGTGPVAEAFVVAFRFPNLFRRWFGEGAFNAAFVPLFARRIEGEGPSAARAFAEEIMAGLLVVLLVLSAICMLAMPWLMYVLAPGFADTPDKFDLAVVMSVIAFPYLLCMSLVALLSGVLNTMGRFAASSATAVLLNVALIGALVVIWWSGVGNGQSAGLILAWGIFAGGVLQLALLYWGAARSGMALKLARPRWSPDTREMIRLGVPGIIAGGATQINIVIGGMVASLQDGAVSYLYYADRLYGLPLGIIGTAIGVVLLPNVSRALKSGDHVAAEDGQNRALEIAMLLTLPAAIALAVIPGPIVQLLFERGRFTAEDTRAVAAALTFFALALPAFVMIKVFQPAFFAREDTATPMRYATASLAINTIGSILLFFLFQAQGLMPHVGIAIASALGGTVNALLLWRGASANGYLTIDARCSRVLWGSLASSVIMGAVLWAGAQWLGALLPPGTTTVLRAGGIGGLIVVGAIVYFAVIFGSGVIKVADVKRALRRRRAKSAG